MKKLIVLAMILVLMVIATAVLAHYPWYLSDEVGNPVEIPVYCDHPSPGDFDGYWYTNEHSGKTHCFKI